MNRFLEKISSLFDESKKEIGFGSKTKIKNSRKVLLFQQLKPLSPIYEKFIDGVIYKDLEFENNDGYMWKISHRLIKLEKLENCDFDWAVIHDLNLSSEFLLSDKISSGFYIDSKLEDSTYDIINNIPFSFVVIDLISKPKYETLSGIFDLTEIITNIDNNIILKLDYEIFQEKYLAIKLNLLYLLDKNAY